MPAKGIFSSNNWSINCVTGNFRQICATLYTTTWLEIILRLDRGEAMLGIKTNNYKDCMLMKGLLITYYGLQSY